MKRATDQSKQSGEPRDGAREVPQKRRDERPEVCGQVSRLVPLVTLEGDRITEAFSARLGLHRTDVQALGFLLDADEQGVAVTAGVLGKELRLTSGATTFCVNRLEKAAFVRRERDPADHRRINIRLCELGRDVGLEFQRPVSALRNNVMGQFSIAELDVVRRFLSMTADAMMQYRAALSDEPVE